MHHICDDKKFEELVLKTPGLCAWGMATNSLYGTDTVFYRINRDLLLHSYREFVICCSWLKDNCLPVKTVSPKAPTSRMLQQMAKTPLYVGHGAMIAAIMHMGFPYRVDPYSPTIQAAVSLRSSCFRSLAPRRSQPLLRLAQLQM